MGKYYLESVYSCLPNLAAQEVGSYEFQNLQSSERLP